MTTYVLDVATWRCGGFTKISSNRMGAGSTKMINDVGYSCCLGQFALQKLRKNGKSRKTAAALVAGTSDPRELADKLNFIYDPNFADTIDAFDEFDFVAKGLTNKLIATNDAVETTVREKIDRIRATLKAHGHILQVRNQHLIP